MPEKCICRQECKAEVHDYDPIEEDSFGTDMYNLGIKQERDRIVKWLRRPLAGTDGFIEDERRNRFDLANAVEKGEHL